jgi:hypothetical protein
LGSATLGQQWRAALSDGVLKARRVELAERLLRPRELPGAVDSRMVFYADLYEAEGQQGGGGVDVSRLSVEEQELVEQLAAAMLNSAAERAGSARDRETAEAELARLAGLGGEEMGVRNLARSALAGVPG